MKNVAKNSPNSEALFKPVKTFGLRLIATCVLLGGVLIGTTACNGGEMSDVDFDSKKAQSLPQAQRDKYIVELFNQILVRGEPSGKPKTGHQRREGRNGREGCFFQSDQMGVAGLGAGVPDGLRQRAEDGGPCVQL